MNGRRIVVIGGGIAGLAVAGSLVRRGARDVTLVEREPVLGAGATGQNAAILRTAIDDPVTAALAEHGARCFATPPASWARDASGRASEFVDARGLVVVAPTPAPWIERARRLDEAERRARVPFLAHDAGPAYLIEREGVVDVPALVAALARELVDAGVRLRLGTHVRALLPRAESGWRVACDEDESLAADVVVLAAGAWAGALGRAAGSRVALATTRRHLIVTAPDARVDARAPVVWSDADGVYVRPLDGGYLACPCDEDPIDPESFATSPEALEAVRAKVARVLPGLPHSPAARFWAGSRAHARDARFVIGRDPDVAGLVWASGLGGHGITCAAAVGELGADAVLESRGAHAIPPDVAAACSPARAGARV